MNYKIYSNTSLIMILFSTGLLAGTGTFVGPNSDLDCDFSTIQGAIDSGASDIKISNAVQYSENLILPDTDSDFSLSGGYTSCSQFSFDISLQSSISGDLNSSPVLIILPSTESKRVTLRNLLITNGTGAGFIPAGGINMSGSNDTLVLTNTTVGWNQGVIGGGVYIGTNSTAPISDQPLLLLYDSQILNNNSNSTTSGGGGVFCEYGLVTLFSNSSIKRNIAAGSGGGLYLNGCSMSDWSGSSTTESPEKGIFNNQAGLHGGGIYATNQSTVQLGTAGGVVNRFGSVVNNQSDSNNDGQGNGGGIYVTDSNVSLVGSVIQNNRSGGTGGGIHAQDQSVITARRQLDQCWRDHKCNQILDNQTSSSGNGGGMYFANAAYGIIETAYFEGNRADNGTAIYTTSEDSDTVIQNSTFYRNGNNGADGFSDNNVIVTNNDSSVISVHNTFFNNAETVSTFRTQNNSNLTIQGNIIFSETVTSAIRVANSLPVTLNCINTNILPPEGTNIFNLNVTFNDEINGDFRLSGSDTGAIDTCPDFGLDEDGEGGLRPYDDSNIPNLGGLFDVGSDEYNDLIFRNGFE